MAKKGTRIEKIIEVLRQVEVLVSQGQKVPEACRKAGITDQTYYRWRKESGGVRLDQAKRFKEVEKEDLRLKKLVADLSLVKKRRAIERVQKALKVSERRACRVLDRLAELFVWRGVPEHIRSDNGPEFTAKAVRRWLRSLDVRPLYIEPGSPWDNGYVESFQGKLRDELLDREEFDTLREAQVLVQRWRQHYNHGRPHSALGYRPPAPEAFKWAPSGCGATPLRPMDLVAAPS